MIPLEEARDFVLSVVQRREPVRVPVSEALGLVLAEDVASAVAIPPFANTAMDGFAVKSADVAAAPVELAIAGTVAAGANPTTELQPGQAMRIFTGAVIPPGADAVVMVELTEAEGDTVRVLESVPEGNHVRGAGDDVQPGDQVFSAGEVLGPGHLGVLLSLGLLEVLVYPQVRVGVVSTGDELVDDGSPLAPGQIRDSNRRTLMSLVERTGAVAVDLGLARDDERGPVRPRAAPVAPQPAFGYHDPWRSRPRRLADDDDRHRDPESRRHGGCRPAAGRPPHSTRRRARGPESARRDGR